MQHLVDQKIQMKNRLTIIMIRRLRDLWTVHVANNLICHENLTCIQYRSKVSYHPSSRFSRDETLVSRDETLVARDETLVARDETLVSRDETLVSREPLKRIFWNTLQAVSLRENDEFLATR